MKEFITGIILFLLALFIIRMINEKSEEVREEAEKRSKERKRLQLEVFESLNSFMDANSITIIIQIAKLDNQTTLKLTRLSHEIKTLDKHEEFLSLKNEIKLRLSDDILELDENLDLLLERLNQFKIENRIEDKDDENLMLSE